MVVSDEGNMDIFLANLTQNDLENEPEIEQEFDSVSAGLQEKTNTLGEDFRFLLNSHSRGNSGITVETARINYEKMNTRMTRKLEEIKSGLDSHI